MKATQYGQSKEYTKLIESFYSFYNKILASITKNIDTKQLELKESIFPDKTASNLNPTLTKVLNQIALEWSTINDLYHDPSVATKDNQCDLVKHCRRSQRIIFIMKIYKTYFLSKYVYPYFDANDAEKITVDNTKPDFIDIFNHALKGYSVIDLLNDFMHIYDVHLKAQQILYKDCKNQNKNVNYNNWVPCCNYLLNRNRRYQIRKERQPTDDNEFDTYIKQLDHTGRNLIELCSKIHTAINHTSFDHQHPKTVSKVRPLNWRAIAIKEEDAKFNKFINEVNGKNTTQNKHNNPMDGLYDLLQKNGLTKTECVQFVNSLSNDEYDTDSVLYDVEDGYKNSNIYQLLNKNKFQLSAIYNYFTALPPFTFGKRIFKYWSSFSKHRSFIKKPKYSSLKQECLNNTIFPIQLTIFNQILNKSYIYTISLKGKRFKARNKGGGNNKYEMPVNLPISISHIFVVIMYCNFNDLQYHYKRYGCRTYGDEDKDEDVRKRNMEIGNWYKLLKECILFYGTVATSNDIFYTGLNQKLSFGTFTPSFRCPFSTSVEWDVANQFADGKGVILELKGLKSSDGDSYFDVEWLSCYPHEQERLFFSASQLEIVDIHTYDGVDIVYNKKYMRAFRLWSSLWNGYFVHQMLANTKHNDTQDTLINLIRCYMENNSIGNIIGQTKERIPRYMQRLFHVLVQELKNKELRARSKIRIITSEFKKLDANLRKLLLEFQDNNKNGNIIMVPSEFIKSLIKNATMKINVMKEYCWKLSDQELNRLKQSKPDEWMYCSKEMVYKLGNADGARGDMIKFMICICRCVEGTKHIGYKFKIKQSSSIVNVYWSICVDEANWMQNGDGAGRLSAGKTLGRKCFRDSLLDALKSVNIRLAIQFWC